MGYAFISYSSIELEYAETISKALRDNGVETWMAPRDIPAGSTYSGVINRALRNAACLVLLLTENSQNSQWVDKEVERAISYGKVIVPVALENVKLNDNFDFYLGNTQIVPVRQISGQSESFVKIIKQVQALTAAETAVHSFAQPLIRYRIVQDNMHSSVHSFAQQLIRCLYEYKSSFQRGDQNSIAATTSYLVEQIERISAIIAEYQAALSSGKHDAEITIESLESITDQFNRYCEPYNAFVNSPDRMSPAAQAYAHQAEIEFSKLLEKAKELSRSDA